MKILAQIMSFLILTSFCYGQKLTNVGIRLNYVNINQQKNEFDNIDFSNNSVKTDRPAFSADLFFNLDLGKIRPRIWVGYERISGTKNEIYNSLDGSRTEYSFYHQISTFRFAAGIGKVISLEDLKINIGPELMFFGRFLQENGGLREEFDSSGNIYSSTELESEQPPYYSLGLGLFATAYYPLWKNFSVGFELSNYFLFGKTSGDIINTEKHFDGDGVNTETITKVNNVDYKGFNTFFLNFSVGFKYAF